MCTLSLPGDVRRVSLGGFGPSQGPEQHRDSGGGGRDGGLPVEALRGAAGGLHGLLHPPEEPLCSGPQEGEGGYSHTLVLHLNLFKPYFIFKIQDSKVLMSYAQSYSVEMAMKFFC